MGNAAFKIKSTIIVVLIELTTQVSVTDGCGDDVIEPHLLQSCEPAYNGRENCRWASVLEWVICKEKLSYQMPLVS